MNNYYYDDVISDCTNELKCVNFKSVIRCLTDDHDNNDNKGELLRGIGNW